MHFHVDKSYLIFLPNESVFAVIQIAKWSSTHRTIAEASLLCCRVLDEQVGVGGIYIPKEIYQ